MNTELARRVGSLPVCGQAYNELIYGLPLFLFEATVPRVPELFLIGDVCRDNLLVEIEALSFVKVAAPKVSGERKATW